MRNHHLSFRALRSLLTCLILTGTIAASANNGPDRCVFRENKGQVGDQYQRPRADVLFSGSDGRMTYHLLRDGVSYQLHKVTTWKEDHSRPPVFSKNPLLKAIPSHAEEDAQVPDAMTIQRLDVKWLGANTHARIERLNERGDYENFYNATAPIGVLDVRTYEGIRYIGIYPGINLRWYGNEGQVEYDFEVGAGADHERIVLRIEGADKLLVNEVGELVMRTPLGDIIEERPLVIQGARKVTGTWVIANNEVRIVINGLDRTKPFTIDPGVRTWGTYYGQSEEYNDWYRNDCITDALGNVYLGGGIMDGTTIATTGSHQVTAGSLFDTYLAQFNVNGARQWATFYGGEKTDLGFALASDKLGHVFLLGHTTSAVSIATPGSFRPQYLGGDSLIYGFIAKFNSAGVRQWGTYTFAGICAASSADASGNLFVVGCQQMAMPQWEPFIPTPGCFQPVFGGDYNDLFLDKFDTNGQRIWGTYYGGPGTDFCSLDGAGGIAAAADGAVFICGTTASPSGIATPGAHQPVLGGEEDDFVVRFDAAGNRLWGTYYGGGDYELCMDAAVDTADNFYLAGNLHTDFYPTPLGVIATPGADRETYSAAGWYSAYLGKFDPDGVRQWGTFFCGDAVATVQHGCAITRDGKIYISGLSYRPPVAPVVDIVPGIATPCSHQPAYNWDAVHLDEQGQHGYWPPWVAQFDTEGHRGWGTFYGGYSQVRGFDVAADETGHVYVSGEAINDTSLLAAFPGCYSDGTEIATPGSFQPAMIGGPDQSGRIINGYLIQFVDPGDAEAALTVCGTEATVDVAATGYQWIDCSTDQPVPGATSGTFTASVDGSYAVILQNGACTDTTGCIDLITPGTLVVEAINQGACAGASDITVSVLSGGSGSYTYQWSPAVSAGPSASDLAPGTYSITVTDVNFCTTATASVQVTGTAPELFVPTAFSPNASGTNDTQCIYGAECLSDLSFRIYDRWGTKVFESTDPKQCWDGTCNGKALNPAVFVYQLSATLSNGEAIERQGNISLIR